MPAYKRKLPHSRMYRVYHEGKIAAMGTTKEKAEAQVRLLNGIHHGMIPRKRGK